MRGLAWVVLLFAAAVVAATTFGRNDGLVSIFWSGWRTDLSLNLFVVIMLAACAVVLLAAHALMRLVSLPRRAQEWRALRRERSAQAALIEAQVEQNAGRYGRARKAALRALALQGEVAELAGSREFAAVALLQAAGAAHRLQDRPGRNELLRRALEAAARGGGARQLDDGLHLMAAEWALEDRDEAQALAELAQLTPGAARRTHAMRLKLQAHRAAREPLPALHMARLLAHHQAFSDAVAKGLLRALAAEALDQARDPDQLRGVWVQLDPADRADPVVAAKAALSAVRLGSPRDAREWLRPLWERLAELEPVEREDIAWALLQAAGGIGADWLPSLEAAAEDHGTDAAVLTAVGACFAECGLYGKARRQLERAVALGTAPARLRRAAWRHLAALARQESDDERAAACEREAAAAE